MDYKIEEQKSDILKIALKPEEEFKARARSVASYGGAVNMNTTTTRSIFMAIGSYEDFPITELTVDPNKSGVVTVSPPLPGEIRRVETSKDSILIQSFGFLGCSGDYKIDLDTNRLYENESLGMVEISGSRKTEDFIFVSGYGGVTSIELGSGERTSVREEHLLAMDSSVSYKKLSSASLKEKALGADRNPYVRISGPGTVYQHARSPITAMKTLDKISD